MWKLLAQETMLKKELKDDYSSLISKAKYTVKHGKGLKILPTDIVQIKALNTSEKVLNEIRKIT